MLFPCDGYISQVKREYPNTRICVVVRMARYNLDLTFATNLLNLAQPIIDICAN